MYRGVVNAGTGASRSFNDVAKALMAVHGPAEIEYIPFPADLEGRYQHFTEADLTGLRELGVIWSRRRWKREFARRSRRCGRLATSLTDSAEEWGHGFRQ